MKKSVDGQMKQEIWKEIDGIDVLAGRDRDRLCTAGQSCRRAGPGVAEE